MNPQRRTILIWIAVCLFLIVFWYMHVPSYAQVFGSKVTNAGGVTCPATGSSIEVRPANGSRQSYAILNDSSLSVRIGFLATGTANLDDTNSIILNAGGSIASSPSNIFFGRIVCMSTTAGSTVIHFTEESRQ